MTQGAWGYQTPPETVIVDDKTLTFEQQKKNNTVVECLSVHSKTNAWPQRRGSTLLERPTNQAASAGQHALSVYVSASESVRSPRPVNPIVT